MAEKQTYEIFGLTKPFTCGSREFFQKMNHPGANNCDCPKFTSDNSCVPVRHQEAWFAYIELNHTRKQA